MTSDKLKEGPMRIELVEKCAECGEHITMNEGSYYQRDPFGGEFGKAYHSRCGDPFGTRAKDKRIAELEAALRDALGAIWELHRWDSRENYERDPTVKRLMSLLPTSDKP